MSDRVYRSLEELTVRSEDGGFVSRWAAFYRVLQGELTYQRRVKRGESCAAPNERDAAVTQTVTAAVNAKDPLEGEHLLLLNNDIEVLSHDFLRELLSYSQRPDVGAVGAKLYYPDDTIQHAGVIMGINGSAGHSHKSYPRKAVGDLYRLVTTQDYMAVTGACLMTKTELYRAAGGLDEAK